MSEELFYVCVLSTPTTGPRHVMPIFCGLRADADHYYDKVSTRTLNIQLPPTHGNPVSVSLIIATKTSVDAASAAAGVPNAH